MENSATRYPRRMSRAPQGAARAKRPRRGLVTLALLGSAALPLWLVVRTLPLPLELRNRSPREEQPSTALIASRFAGGVRPGLLRSIPGPATPTPHVPVMTADPVHDHRGTHGGQVTARVPAGPLEDSIEDVPVVQPPPQIDLRDPVYDVRAHGAKGNGSDDDTAAIRAAIDAAAASGGCVFFPAGIYPIDADGTEGIVVPRKVSLRGAGRDISVLRFRGTPRAGSVMVHVTGPATQTVLEDLTIAGPLRKFGSHEDVIVQGVYVSSGKSALSGTVVLRRMRVFGCYQGIYVSPNAAAGNTITLTVLDCDLQSYQAIMFAGQGRCFIHETDVHGCGINASSNPRLLNRLHGVYIYPGVSLEVAHCRFSNYAPRARGYAIHIYGPDSTDHADFCRVVHCAIDVTHYAGILTNANRLTRVIGCTIAATSTGVELKGDADILGCTFDGPATALKGYDSGKAAAARVQSCRFVSKATRGALIQPLIAGSVWQVAGCHFPNHTPAEAMTVDPGTKLTWRDCSFADSAAGDR